MTKIVDSKFVSPICGLQLICGLRSIDTLSVCQTGILPVSGVVRRRRQQAKSPLGTGWKAYVPLIHRKQRMPSESSSVSELELGHVLFMDIVGYSKLLVDEQSDVARRLNQIVRETEQFRSAEAKGKLIRLPTGDGMALVFFTSPEAPIRCALEISRALRENP